MKDEDFYPLAAVVITVAIINGAMVLFAFGRVIWELFQ